MSSRLKHIRQPGCPRCREIIGRYPGFDRRFQNWFFELQQRHPEAHVSTAGVDENDQELLFSRHATRRRWKADPANWNAAMSIFNLSSPAFDDGLEVYWFNYVIGRNLPTWLDWHGWTPGYGFEPSLVFLRNWEEMAEDGRLTLIGES